MESIKHSKKSKKKSPFAKVFLWTVILILINILVYQIWFQIDLTHDKRYTIHEKTKNLLNSLEEPISIKILLTGDKLPSGFKRLASRTEDIVRDFREISNNKVDYSIIDPLKADTHFLKDIQTLGISSLPVTVAQGKGNTEQIPVTPYAIVEKGEKKIPILLQSYKTAQLTESDFDNSVVLLEYNIANAIRKINKPHLDTILYLLGHQEPEGYDVFQLANALNTQYIFSVDSIQYLKSIPSSCKAVIINKPLTPFSDRDLYLLDQYVMNGGNILFALDATNASFDSFKTKPIQTVLPIETGLNSLLFNYGVRINSNLVSDLEKCVDIPLQHEDNSIDQSQFFPWTYFPVLSTNEEHPISKNLNEILSKFTSSLEFVNDKAEIKKEPLLFTSNYSRTEPTPLNLDLTSAMIQPKRGDFPLKNILTGVIMEGTFESLYAAHFPESLAKDNPAPTIKGASHAKIAVFSDGDLFLNDVSAQTGPKEMGTYIYSPYVFNNKSLLLNTIEYLTDDDNLLEVRNKTYQASLLDKKRKISEATQWQLINIGLPIIVIILFGITFTFIRKRKYTK